MNPEKKYILKGCKYDVAGDMKKKLRVKTDEKNCPMCGSALEFHSSIARFYCLHCREYFKYDYVMNKKRVGKGE